MNKIDAFKLAVRVIAGAGATTITKSIIQNNVQPSNPWEAISVVVASVAAGSMASEAVRAHTDTQIDKVVEAWNTAKSKETPVTA